ncbi:MAG: dephospho-CoA kinase [Candidatus Omnitrophica bacterium]|nr:dephospho-CoA kinase [Candidatus Omnitrophota bacterium]
MLKIGITGNFGVGKTTVAAMFKAHGVKVIDADELAHALMKQDRVCQQAIRKSFGDHLIGKQGVDRATLAKIVFNDPKALKTLEGILHPHIRKMITDQIKRSASRIVAVDAAILIEAGWDKLVDRIIVVKAKRDVQIKRAMARTGLSRSDVLKRIHRQMPLKEKIKFAAYVIDNSGTPASTKKHVERIFRSLKQTPIQQEQVS